jgi:hypothetical protein
MNQKISRVDVEPAKPRKWTEEETRLLIELAQRKERVPAMARELIPNPGSRDSGQRIPESASF